MYDVDPAAIGLVTHLHLQLTVVSLPFSAPSLPNYDSPGVFFSFFILCPSCISCVSNSAPSTKFPPPSSCPPCTSCTSCMLHLFLLPTVQVRVGLQDICNVTLLFHTLIEGGWAISYLGWAASSGRPCRPPPAPCSPSPCCLVGGEEQGWHGEGGGRGTLHWAVKLCQLFPAEIANFVSKALKGELSTFNVRLKWGQFTKSGENWIRNLILPQFNFNKSVMVTVVVAVLVGGGGEYCAIWKKEIYIRETNESFGICR